ncbi:hypothetical protein TGP89_328300 [Toxoplasma gondii p89]|uniref:RNA recognition motif protein n=1 Tax=Toxoplasma gondii p89 TaxID=943119 RepID=A0A086K3Y6_TOXGO|nr:hypothetical protein TGP89_328300 [Toxoplasma gondii p89]
MVVSHVPFPILRRRSLHLPFLCILFRRGGGGAVSVSYFLFSVPVFFSAWGGPSYAVYVTYSTVPEAIAAIQSIDGAVYEGRTLKASFGTTKYAHLPPLYLA